MRRLKILVTACVAIFILGCAYQSEAVEGSPVDPVEVMENWELMTSNSIGGMPIHFFLNPEEKAVVRKAATILHNYIIFGFAYLLDGEIHLYVLDWETGKYWKGANVNLENWLDTFRTAFGE